MAFGNSKLRPINETTGRMRHPPVAARACVYAGQWRWRWDLNPRKTCAFTRFRVLRGPVHHRPRTYVTWAEGHPASAGERSRTGVNETETETGGQGPLRGSTPEGRGSRRKALMRSSTERGP